VLHCVRQMHGISTKNEMVSEIAVRVACDVACRILPEEPLPSKNLGALHQHLMCVCVYARMRTREYDMSMDMIYMSIDIYEYGYDMNMDMTMRVRV